MKDVFMAVAMDLGDPISPFGSVHPRDKQDVGYHLEGQLRIMMNQCITPVPLPMKQYQQFTLQIVFL